MLTSLLLAIWVVSSLVGCLVSALSMRNARRDQGYIELKRERTSVEVHLARSTSRREATKFAVFLFFMVTGVVGILGSQEIFSEQVTVVIPILLTTSTVLLSTGSLMNYLDDKQLREEIRRERHE